MDKGSLVEIGTHKRTFEMRGRYFALIVNRRLVLTDLHDSNTSSKSESPNEASRSTNQQLNSPEGLIPWEGSSMAVRQGSHWSSSLIWISSFLF